MNEKVGVFREWEVRETGERDQKRKKHVSKFWYLISFQFFCFFFICSVYNFRKETIEAIKKNAN